MRVICAVVIPAICSNQPSPGSVASNTCLGPHKITDYSRLVAKGFTEGQVAQRSASTADPTESRCHPPELTLPKDFRRINARGAVRGQPTGERADDAQDRRRRGDRERIVRLKSVQQR